MSKRHFILNFLYQINFKNLQLTIANFNRKNYGINTLKLVNSMFELKFQSFLMGLLIIEVRIANNCRGRVGWPINEP